MLGAAYLFKKRLVNILNISPQGYTSGKGVPRAPSYSCRTWCPHGPWAPSWCPMPMWASNFTTIDWYSKTTFLLR
jgi:hypothetical protein